MTTPRYMDKFGLEYYHNLIKKGLIEYIVGTQTGATNAWTGVSKSPSLFAGKVIIYHLPFAGTGAAATLNLTLTSGSTTGAKAVQNETAGAVTTEYAADSDIFMVYTGSVWKCSAVDTTYAPLASPEFTGTPTAPTAAEGTSTTQIATTEFTTAAVGAEATIRQSADSNLAAELAAEKARVDSLVLGTTTNASGWNVETLTQNVTVSGGSASYNFTIPADATVLEVAVRSAASTSQPWITDNVNVYTNGTEAYVQADVLTVAEVVLKITYGKQETINLPELTDIRLGADGKTYSTAGEAVRGQISDVKEDLNLINGDGNIELTFEQGTIGSNNGYKSASDRRIRTSDFIATGIDVSVIYIRSDLEIAAFMYNASKGYIGNTPFGKSLPEFDATTAFVKYVVKLTSNANITPSDVADGDIKLTEFHAKANQADLDALQSEVDALESNNYIPPKTPHHIYMCRDGRATSDVPPNSIYAIDATAENQYDRIRFSLTKTTDGKYVCVHDVTINKLAVNTDGTPISTTISTASCSLAELNQYDWGLKFGSQYAGLKVPEFEPCIARATARNLPVALDIKWTVTDEDIDAISDVLIKYGQTDCLLMAVVYASEQKFQAKNPEFSYLFAGEYSNLQNWADRIATLLGRKNHVYFAMRPIGTLPSAEALALCASKGIDVMHSQIDSVSMLINDVGFDSGITLFECHHIPHIKTAVQDALNNVT